MVFAAVVVDALALVCALCAHHDDRENGETLSLIMCYYTNCHKIDKWINFFLVIRLAHCHRKCRRSRKRRRISCTAPRIASLSHSIPADWEKENKFRFMSLLSWPTPPQLCFCIVLPLILFRIYIHFFFRFQFHNFVCVCLAFPHFESLHCVESRQTKKLIQLTRIPQKTTHEASLRWNFEQVK